MKNLKTVFYIGVLLFAIACNTDEKQKMLNNKAAELGEREKLIASKEAEHQALLKLRDSVLSKKDSVHINPLPFSIDGKWSGKIVCTESGCQDYVVGDTRIDEWEISENDGEITASNLNKTGAIRVYKGKYDGSAIRLFFSSEADAPKHLDLKIDLTTLEEKKLSGTREVQIDKDCLSKFTIELTR